MEDKFKPRFFSVNDFRDWDQKGELVLVPYFQRRAVWDDNARSYLIDSIVRGYPVPQIYMRIKIDLESKKSKREVVDGQQRLRAILDFLQDKFTIMSMHNQTYAGVQFSKLQDEIQEAFLKYELSTTLILDDKDTTVLDIFARLNTYTITLNKLERLNARYFGLFKRTAFNLGLDLNRFWLDNKILNPQKIYRMEDAELCANLLIAMMDGLKSSGSKILEEYFKRYDEVFKDREKLIERFKKIIDVIGELFSNNLVNSKFHEKGLFFILFCIVYDSIYGLKDSPAKRPLKLARENYSDIKGKLLDLDSKLKNPEKYKLPEKVIKALSGHTNNFSSKVTRYNFILGELETRN